MGLRGPRVYLTEAVMDEAEEADEVVVASVADGRLTREEVRCIRREIRDVVHASEAATIAQRIADNVLRGEIAESTRRRAIEAGLLVPDFRAAEPRDAA